MPLSDLLLFNGAPIAEPSGWAEKRAAIRATFTDLLGEGVTEAPPLDARVHEEVDCGTYVRRRVSFASERDDRVTAFLCVPHGLKSPQAAVLILHGTTAAAKDASAGLDRTQKHYGMAPALAERGFITLAPDHFCAGERLGPGQKPYDTGPLYERHPRWSAMGKAIWDQQRCVDYLLGIPEVAGDRIGVIGHSLGGHSAVFFAAMDERVKACVSSCGVTAWNLDPNRLNWSRNKPGQYVYFPKLRAFWESGRNAPLDFHEVFSLIAPRACLNISAVGNDSCFPVFEPFAELYVQVERVYKLLRAEGQFACYFHSEAHSFNRSPRELAYAWMAEKLA